MYQNKILDSYKSVQKYVQDKQIAHDLGISTQKISKIRKGERYLTESEALFMAEKIGLETEEVLIYLAADRSKTFEAQQAWQQIAKKFNHQGFHMFSVSFVGLLGGYMTLKDPMIECALYILC